MNTFHKRHPHLGHYLFIFGAFLLLVSLVLLLPLSGSSKAFGASDIIDASNQARQKFNLPPLNTNDKLIDAAQMRAIDMANKRYFSHTAPDGAVAWDYLKKVNFTYQYAGENLAITNEDADDIINGWLDSPTHRDNLLSKKYDYFGIGIAYFGDYEGHKDTYVVVALYASPAHTQYVTAPVRSYSGTSSFFKPDLVFVSPYTAIAIGGLIMTIGALIELRHIKHLQSLAV